MTKTDIRKAVRKYFAQLAAEEYTKKCSRVHNQLYRTEQWRQARMIALTLSTKNEIDTRAVIKKAWSEGKQVAVPKVNPLTHSMTFYKLTSFNQLKEQYAGIQEPDASQAAPVLPEDIQLMIVPGLAFDWGRYRIGFGGGYYDRFLAAHLVPTCALALDFQLFEKLPREEHDKPVDIVLTEEKVFR
ncbi:5-formyltetrahydrofolate cyclo-ligase [Thalassobacillus sp. C254]|uniref:5-formyltetrahydrofolate cyclo-ligase n=1 Tax=Thalassobacillus sp. C254 TaxID=1225341 RepID=UPI0006CFEC29|nr:5-formyltetrahydrofolate cyclo-ligase [Thalassobacillus sp. C254]